MEVLILILMEYDLREEHLLTLPTLHSGLNPYSNGRYSMRLCEEDVHRTC